MLRGTVQRDQRAWNRFFARPFARGVVLSHVRPDRSASFTRKAQPGVTFVAALAQRNARKKPYFLRLTVQRAVALLCLRSKDMKPATMDTKRRSGDPLPPICWLTAQSNRHRRDPLTAGIACI
jgi:hypothetical protein